MKLCVLCTLTMPECEHNSRKVIFIKYYDFAKSGHFNHSPDFFVLTNPKYLDMMQISLDTMCVDKKHTIPLLSHVYIKK